MLNKKERGLDVVWSVIGGDDESHQYPRCPFVYRVGLWLSMTQGLCSEHPTASLIDVVWLIALSHSSSMNIDHISHHPCRPHSIHRAHRQSQLPQLESHRDEDLTSSYIVSTLL